MKLLLLVVSLVWANAERTILAPGGWRLPADPTEVLAGPEPVTTTDPYSMKMMMPKMMMPKMMMPKDMMNMPKNMMNMPKNMMNMPKNMMNMPKNMMMMGNGKSAASFADQNYLCANAACTSKVQPGQGQPNYQCAEFVARTIASTGEIPGLTSTSPQSAYGSYKYNGKTYDLLWTSNKTGGPLGLEDYLKAAGWTSGGSVKDGSVAFVNGSHGAYGHVAVGVGNNLLDAHNVARYHVAPSFYHINAIYNPPS